MHLTCATHSFSLNKALKNAHGCTLSSRRHVTATGFSSHPFWGSTGARRSSVVRAKEDDMDEEEAFEKRIADLKKAKGETPYGEGKKKAKSKAESGGGAEEVDYSGETVFYEGSPHSGDLAVNLLLGATVLWLPLTFAAIGRKAFVRYKFTDKRISVTTTAPWATNQTDVSYSQVRNVVALGRGVGLWGDMVVTLKNGDKIEIRSLDRWMEIKDYILQMKTAADSSTSSAQTTPSGF